MSKANRCAATLALVVVATSPAQAQQLVLTERNISLQLARMIADGVIEHCQKDGYDISVVVVDRLGQVRVSMRGDKAAPHNFELARRKAYTARTFRRTSADWAKRTSGASDLAGQRNLADVIALGGGVPIDAGGETIGGVGVSGAPGQDKDEACAQAGVSKVADKLK